MRQKSQGVTPPFQGGSGKFDPCLPLQLLIVACHSAARPSPRDRSYLGIGLTSGSIMEWFSSVCGRSHNGMTPDFHSGGSEFDPRFPLQLSKYRHQ